MKCINGFSRIRSSGKASRDLYYAMPRIASVSLIIPITLVQGIYAKYYGMELTTIAGIILFVRLLDVITDPVIGYLSDRYKTKRGTRKPFIILGAIILIVSGYFLYTPPDNVGATYFAFWFTFIFFGNTLFEVSHMAWGGEISRNTYEKTQTYNLRAASGYLGLVLFYGIPLLPIWTTSEITPDSLHFSAIVSALLMLPLLYLCIKRVPNGSCYNREYKEDSKNEVNQIAVQHLNKPLRIKTKTLIDTVTSVIHNKPLILFLAAFLFTGIALGMWFGLLFLFVDAYLGKGEFFSEIYLITCIFGVASTWIWIQVANRIGKKNTWLVAMIFGITCFVYTSFLGPDNSGYWSLLILLIVKTLCFVCVESMPQSMLSDIVDYATLKFRIYQGGTYFSLFLFIYKGAFTIGTALGLAIAGWYGFDPSGANHSNGIAGLRLAMTWIPIGFASLAIVFIVLSPITEQRHRIIRRRLDALEARTQRQNQEKQYRSDSIGPSNPQVIFNN